MTHRQRVAAVAVCTIWGLCFVLIQAQLPSSTPLVSLLILGIAGTGVAYGVWFRLARTIPLVSLAPALYAVPVVGFAAGIVAGNRPTALEVAGIAGLLAGIALASNGLDAVRDATGET